MINQQTFTLPSPNLCYSAFGSIYISSDIGPDLYDIQLFYSMPPILIQSSHPTPCPPAEVWM